MDIDNLSVSLKVNGADDAIQRIQQIATAIDTLAKGITQVDASKVQEVANGLSQLKSNAPTANQAANMEKFAGAMGVFASALGGLDISQVASDISNMAGSLTGMGTRGVNAFNSLANAAQNYNNQVQQAAQNAQNVTPNSQNKSKNAAQNAQNLKSAFLTVNQELNKTAIATDSIGAKLEKMGAIVPTNKFKTLTERLDNVRRKYDELRTKMNEALLSGDVTPDSKEFQRWSRDLEGIRNDYDRLIEKQRAMALEGRGFELSPTLKSGLDGFKKGFSGTFSTLKRFGSAIVSANRHLGSFVKNLIGANSAQKAMKKTMEGLKSMPKKFASELTRIGKMLKLMVTRMALRQVIKEVGEGFKSLAVHSDAFNESMSSVINASKQLGYSFAAMVSPLINALAPAIVYIINLLTKLLNIINQVFSALSGASSWNKAKTFTDSWRDSFDKTGKAAGKAAKELKKTVLGFDELNQLQDNKNSGGGGGSDIADMFETVKIDPKWKEFADWLKEMWNNKDFTELGKLWGTKLRDWLESIPWEKIRKTSNDLGKCLATLINGLVEVERLGYDIGYTVAQGVNTIFEFINGFVHNLHWDSIGKFIAETFNGFFETIDWKLIKDTVVTGLKGLADAINSFIENFHWDNISNFIINGVDTIVSGIYTFFKTVKWKELGANLGEQLQKTISGINWKDVGKAIGSILQAAIDFVSNFVKKLNIDDIRKALKDLVDGFFDEVDTEELGKMLADIIDLVVQVAAGFWKDNGARIKEEGKKLISSLWDNVDSQTKNDLMKVFAQIVVTCVLGGLALASVKITASAIFRGFSNKIMSALFGGGSGAGGASGAVATEAGAAGTAAASTFASKFIAGLSAAAIPVALTSIFGYGLASHFSKELEPIIEENKKVVDGLKQGMENTIPTYEQMSQAAREASHNQKEYAEHMQSMYDQLLKTHPELQNLKDALEQNGIKIGNNVERLLQINEGLQTFQTNGGSASETLSQLEDKYGKVDKKTQDFFNSLGLCEDKYSGVIDKVNEYKRSLEENEAASNNLIKVYKSESEVLEDQKRAHDNVIGSFKTHWDVINQNKDATEKLNSVSQTYKTHLDVIKEAQAKNVEQTAKAKEAYDKVKETTKEFTNVLQENKPAYEGVRDAAKEASDTFEVYVGATNDVIGVMPEMTDGAKDVQTSLNDLSSSVEDTTSTIKSSFTKDNWTFSGVAEGLKETFLNAKSVIKGAWNSIATVVNGEHEIGEKKIKIKLPTFASGGFPEDGLFMANRGELVGSFSNGKTAVANNEQIISGIERGVYNAVTSAMSQGGRADYISNTIVVDGDVIARSITKAQESTNRRYSPQTV